ncbi:secondary thiamine-phosphate synthase enzyme [Hydrogenispora ethanolica]|jgi:secondary thiamine-phosphate synthase enzyme|uniref:Secondary thiamine-phosphate synthase enzyme n=1 Tax=Hydrogenispora ethanolica TaxID=1082276 RepID=A0A4R1RWB6_HYDET|nr:secondary thiamine-phosphate synthase enzyme YjbQ [Hydrogenispora ethanolica]TCL70975.1 secondary thiamine-phosphate synthase enzyme [Hydrogenispora ethanolica]
MWQELRVPTRQRTELIDLTARIQSELDRVNVRNGVCYCFVPHTTAGITMNENADPDVVRDILVTLEKLVPRHGDYRHGEGNSDAHLKASLLGFSCMVPVEDGRLALGTWQGIYFCEFDGPRNRKVRIGFLSQG